MSLVSISTTGQTIKFGDDVNKAKAREQQRLELGETFGRNPNLYSTFEELYFCWLDKICSHLTPILWKFILEYKEQDPEDSTKFVVFVTPAHCPLDLVNYTYFDTIKYFRQYTNEQVRPLHLTGNSTTPDNLTSSERERHEGILALVYEWHESQGLPLVTRSNRIPTIRRIRTWRDQAN